MTDKRVIVIGAGASGAMAAGRAAESGAEVLLLEKMKRPGKKILISGQTRCNLTNIRELDDFIAMYGTNGRFLHSAFLRYFRDDLLAFLKRYGVDTKTETDGRIFPASDDASDVVKALKRYMADHRVQLRTSIRATGIQIEVGRVTGVQTEQGLYPAAAVVLATGGASYPSTGSSGDGYRMAEAVGHTIIKLRPSLVPLAIHEVQLARSMQGVSLRNVRLTAYQCRADEIDPSLTPTRDLGRGTGHEKPHRPIIESRLGEMMMTHFGIGGPITLQMSLAIVDALDKGPVSVSIDLQHDLSEKQLHQLLQQDFKFHGKRSCRRIISGLLPHKMIEPFIEMAGILPDKPVNQISAEERKGLISLLKSLRFNIKGPLPIASAMVTAGGVSLKEIDPRTMASRLVAGLYFCGEVIDLDATTG
ncbi:MAG TPA: NAD(P)/FAD-dependent oxidoreductase, partial [Dehalococcoidia bacterium]|nr:NAD(P)/FAD-dependent oxidoreductase [Dehalococcoidia bacterium]